MIAKGQISEKGVLAPSIYVPYQPFMNELSRRGIQVEEEVSDETV
jgi:predicted nuclease with RNAse H fold